MSIAYQNYLDWRGQQQTFDDIAAFRAEDFNLTGGTEEPERVRGALATASYFKVMALPLALGSGFAEKDDLAGGANVVVLGNGFWRRRFGGDLAVVGRRINLNETSYEVIGVAAAALNNPADIDVYLPFGYYAERPFLTVRGNHPGLYGVGRLKSGLTVSQANADFGVICNRLANRYPDTNAGKTVIFTPLLESTVGQYRPTLWLLFASVGFVLLIACANFANLLLARGAGRGKEFAVRAALGASRSRLISQLLTESIVLAVLGGAAGSILSFWCVHSIIAIMPTALPRLSNIRVDATLLVFMSAVSIATGILSGLIPALRASDRNLSVALNDAARGGTGGERQQRGQSILVVAQVAIACVLLVGAGLLLKSFSALQRIHLGFDADRLLTLQLRVPRQKYAGKAAEEASFYLRVGEKISTLPGVLSAALSNNPPFGRERWKDSFAVTGKPDPLPGEEPLAECQEISPGFFRTMGIPLVQGRDFEPQDSLQQPSHVAIVDQAFARRFFPGEDPIGKQLNDNARDRPRQQFTIVGVVPTTEHDELGKASDKLVQLYLPPGQRSILPFTVLVRTAGDPLSFSAAVRGAVEAIDSNQPVYDIGTMKARVAGTLARERLSSVLIGLFSGLALLLATVGLYGTIAYVVTRRTREIGIRLAVGAQRASIFGLILKRGLALVAIGLAVGLLGAYAIGRALGSFLYEVRPNDPAILVTVTLVLSGAALLALWLPARRAMNVNPIVALRTE